MPATRLWRVTGATSCQFRSARMISREISNWTATVKVKNGAVAQRHVQEDGIPPGSSIEIGSSDRATESAGPSRQSGRLACVKRTHKGPLRDVLATNMRRLRAARGLSQEALAHECGMNRTYLSAVEPADATSPRQFERSIIDLLLKGRPRRKVAATELGRATGRPAPCAGRLAANS